MTTIAYDGSTLAADTGVTGGGMKFLTTKVYRLPCGGMAALAGDAAAAVAFGTWLAGGQKGKRPSLKPLDGIMVYGDGRAFSLTTSWPPVPLVGPIAAGSGAQAAMAAMLLGKSAREAVELASMIDPDTFGKVDEMQSIRPKDKP